MIDENDIEKVFVELTEQDLEICKFLSNNTLNTWQGNRTKEEKFKDICLGKFAEKALKDFFNNNKDNNFFYEFYDDFREDGFKLHNDVDFIFSKSDTNIKKR